MNVTLSICIATFNRAAFIGETLDSIIPQATEEVEIVIVDGASTDNTEQIVRDYQRKFTRLRYFRQETNQGVDRDFSRAVELSGGEYCWLMSDDDLLKPGAVAVLLKALRKSYSLVIVNAEVRNADCSKLLEHKRLRFDEDRTYNPTEIDRLFAETCIYLTFIGCVVIKREIWIEREKEKYLGSLFIHVGIIFQSALPADALVISRPCISIRYGNAMWKPKEFEIWMIKWPTLVWSLPGLSNRTKREFCRADPWRQMKTLLLYRAKGTYSLTEYRRWIKPRIPSLREKLKALLVALMPGVLANFLGLFYFTVLYRDSGMILLDLKKSRYYFRNWFAKVH